MHATPEASRPHEEQRVRNQHDHEKVSGNEAGDGCHAADMDTPCHPKLGEQREPHRLPDHETAEHRQHQVHNGNERGCTLLRVAMPRVRITPRYADGKGKVINR